MPIRSAELTDLPALLDLFAEARRFMAATGNPNQWPPSYPSPAQLTADINARCSYVLEEDGRILASFFFSVAPDPTYAVITDGQWLTDGPYGVIHRIAVAEHGRGVAAQCVAWCAEHADVLRIDTHHDNTVMQRFLQKQGFTRCGIIFLADGRPRIAFERIQKLDPVAE